MFFLRLHVVFRAAFLFPEDGGNSFQLTSDGRAIHDTSAGMNFSMSMLSTVLHTVESAAIAASLTCKVFEGERGDEKREVSVFPVAVVVERLHPQTKVKTLTWGLASETA